MKHFEINSLDEYLRAISEQQGLGTFVFRGQPNALWKLVSGVYRRIKESKVISQPEDTTVKSSEVLEYLAEKLAEVRRRMSASLIAEIHEINDMSILVEMQHYGAATNLIDFTFNSVLALYFACFENPDTNGKVFSINNSNPFNALSTNQKELNTLFPMPEGKFYSYSPNHSNKRIVKQDSIFLFNDSGYIDDHFIDFVLTINHKAKKEILLQLEYLFAIKEESIYPDFIGYLQANSARKPFKIKNAKDYFELAVRLHKTRDFKQAVHFYGKSLELKSDHFEAHSGISQCLRILGKYEEALKRALEALKFNPDNFTITNEIALNHTFLRDYTNAKQSFEVSEKKVKNAMDKYMHLNNKGWMYLLFKEYDIALEILQSLVKNNDDKRLNPLINIAHCFLLKEEKEEAIKCYVYSHNNGVNAVPFWEVYNSDHEVLCINKNLSDELRNEIQDRVKTG